MTEFFVQLLAQLLQDFKSDKDIWYAGPKIPMARVGLYETGHTSSWVVKICKNDKLCWGCNQLFIVDVPWLIQHVLHKILIFGWGDVEKVGSHLWVHRLCHVSCNEAADENGHR